MSRRVTASVPAYPLINTSNEMDDLPDGSIVMMSPASTTSPVLWARVGPRWVKLDPLDDGGRESISSLALFQRRIAAGRTRKLALVWTMPNR